MKKVNIILLGGLGNQLFIYAAYKTIFKKKNYNPNFHVISYLSPFKKKYFDLRFVLKKRIYEKKFFFNFFERIYFTIKFKILTKMINDDSNIENFNKLFYYKNYSICGYFQKKKWYLNSYKEVISEVINSLSSKYLELVKSNHVVLSTNSFPLISKMNYVIQFSYYFNSLKKLKITKNSKIFIVGYYGDSYIDNLKIFLKKKGYKNCVSYDSLKLKKINLSNMLDKSIFDFLTIAKSKNLVMSNSTFCWWAALSREFFKLKSELVISPKKYTNDKNMNFNNPGNPNLKWIYINNKLSKYN